LLGWADPASAVGCKQEWATLPARRKIFGRLSILAGNTVRLPGLQRVSCSGYGAIGTLDTTAVIAMVVGWILLISVAMLLLTGSPG